MSNNGIFIILRFGESLTSFNKNYFVGEKKNHVSFRGVNSFGEYMKKF